MADTRPRLIVFARPPRIGRGKRRLAAEIGDVAAWSVYRRLLGKTLRAVGRDPRWRIELWLAEPARIRLPWAEGLEIHIQRGGDLGARMAHALCAAGPLPSLLIGSDISDVRAADISVALQGLAGADAVFGRANDGGFWLVGVAGPLYRRRALLRNAFAQVRWSSEHTLADTLRSLTGARIAFAAEKQDVDTAEDLEAAGL